MKSLKTFVGRCTRELKWQPVTSTRYERTSLISFFLLLTYTFPFLESVFTHAACGLADLLEQKKVFTFNQSSTFSVLRWGYVNAERVLYWFYKIILKNNRESKRHNRVYILSPKYTYRPMRAHVVAPTGLLNMAAFHCVVTPTWLPWRHVKTLHVTAESRFTCPCHDFDTVGNRTSVLKLR